MCQNNGLKSAIVGEIGTLTGMKQNSRNVVEENQLQYYCNINDAD